MIFFERPSLAIDIPAPLERISRELVGLHFDHEKFRALSAALLLLRSRRSSIRVAIIANDVPAFLDQINGGVRLVFADSYRLTISSVAEFLESAEHGIDLLVVLVNDELARLAIADRVVDYVSNESFIFIDAMFELDRYDSVISKRAQFDRLERRGFVTVCDSYYALLSRGYGYFGNYVDMPEPFDSEVQKRSLFIFGCERSGTSLVVQLLNSRNDVFVTYEANWFRPQRRICPITTFNRTGYVVGKPIDKGSYLPEWCSVDVTIEALFRELQKFYCIAGDKMAFGPRQASYERPVSELMREFLERYFPFSRVVLVSRDPVVNCYASHRIRPETKLIYIVDNWLSGILQTIHILMTNDRSALLTHDRLCCKSTIPLENLTGLDFSGALDLIDLKEVSSRLSAAQLYFAGEDQFCSDIVLRAAAIYANFLVAVPEAGRPHTKAQRESAQSCYAQFAHLYEELKDGGEW